MDRARYMSLREIGRQLNVPPSTIVYYKDKFERFIPSSGGEGRRRRYPLEALEIFRRIRKMFGENWTVGQIENELALKFSSLVKNDQHSQQLTNGGVHGHGLDLEGVLARISGALDNQDLFRSEVRSLRDEVLRLEKAQQAMQGDAQQKIERLERQVEELITSNARLEQMLRGKPSGGIAFPTSEYLERPLVIRSGGEFLGVQGGRDKHFSLKDFVGLIERKASTARVMETSWRSEGENWILVVRTDDSQRNIQQDVVLVTAEITTPSGNTVTEIVRLNIDGVDAPDSLLLSLFRQVRTVFGG